MERGSLPGAGFGGAAALPGLSVPSGSPPGAPAALAPLRRDAEPARGFSALPARGMRMPAAVPAWQRDAGRVAVPIHCHPLSPGEGARRPRLRREPGAAPGGGRRAPSAAPAEPPAPAPAPALPSELRALTAAPGALPSPAGPVLTVRISASRSSGKVIPPALNSGRAPLCSARSVVPHQGRKSCPEEAAPDGRC